MHHMAVKELNKTQSNMRKCLLCFEEGYQITPGAIFTGTQNAKIMIIGQAPGRTEVEAKRPFNAGSGRRLFQWLGEAGWEESDFRRDQYMTAVTKCYPGKNVSGRGDRVPSKNEQMLCRPFLLQELKFVDPRLIIPVGSLAISLFYEQKTPLKEVIGTAKYFPENLSPETITSITANIRAHNSYQDQFSRSGRWIVPLPHPSGASIWPNKPENKMLINRAINLLNDIRLAWVLG
jgi:uracil-DNA glycosylase